MTTIDKHFADEEVVRKAREKRAAEHDCVEAGCTVAPDGQPIGLGNRAEKKPLDQDAADALKRLKDAGVVK